MLIKEIMSYSQIKNKITNLNSYFELLKFTAFYGNIQF